MNVPSTEEFREIFYKHFVKYQSNISHDVSRLKSEYRKYERFWYHNLIKRGLVKGNCLDVGCGMGHLLYALQKNGYSATGIDRSKENADICRQNGFSVIDGDMIAYLENRRDHQWDTIILSDVLEHFTVEEAYAVLKLLRSGLNPGGRILLKIPNGGSVFTGIYLLSADPTHKSLFTETSIRALGAAAGFSRVDVYPADLFVFYHNPLNYIGMIFDLINVSLHKFIFYFNGMFEKSVHTKNMIVALKP